MRGTSIRASLASELYVHLLARMAILPVVIVAFIAIPLAQTASATGGSVYAWGYNSFGECNVPAGLNNAVAVQCGNYFSMALRANGTVATWGDNGFGLL